MLNHIRQRLTGQYQFATPRQAVKISAREHPAPYAAVAVRHPSGPAGSGLPEDGLPHKAGDRVRQPVSADAGSG